MLVRPLVIKRLPLKVSGPYIGFGSLCFDLQEPGGIWPSNDIWRTPVKFLAVVSIYSYKDYNMGKSSKGVHAREKRKGSKKKKAASAVTRSHVQCPTLSHLAVRLLFSLQMLSLLHPHAHLLSFKRILVIMTLQCRPLVPVADRLHFLCDMSAVLSTVTIEC